MKFLYRPQSLNLTAVSETILIDNLNVFEMNGFKFKINEENPSGERVQLVSVPVSHNWRFGKEGNNIDLIYYSMLHVKST